jgi:hypothetical protein
MVDAEVEIIPPGAWETGADLIIQPDLVVSSERRLHRWPQHIVALFVGDAPASMDAHHVVGQFLDEFDHRTVPNAASHSIRRKYPPAIGRRVSHRVLSPD